MPFLPLAEYELTGEMAGFKKAIRAGVILETASTQTLFRSPAADGTARSCYRWQPLNCGDAGRVFHTTAFIDPGVGVFGDSPRNVAHGPGVVNT
jgi:hypothetical protein